MQKTCNTCRSVKPRVGFAPDRRNSDGRQGRCRSCTNAATARWVNANPERKRALRVKHAAAHAAANRARRAAEPERHRAAVRRWQEANPQLRAAMKKMSDRRRRARKRGTLVVRFTAAQLAARLSMFAGCWMCGGEWTEVEHVKPLASAGAHCLANLRPSCAACNRRKGRRWLGVRWAAGLSAGARRALPRPFVS